MKKIIAVLLSIQLIVLSGLPAGAQGLPATQQLAKEVLAGFKPQPKELLGATGAQALLSSLDRYVLTGMRLPLPLQYTQLLSQQPGVSLARQMLTHPNAAERALLLRTDFTALALQHRISEADRAAGVAFYRGNLQRAANSRPHEIVADMTSLGLLGEREDRTLILQTALQSVGSGYEAVVTAAAARALLRLGAYEELKVLAKISNVQPALWEGIVTYIDTYRIPVTLSVEPARKTVDTAALQRDLMPLGPMNSLVVNPSVESTFLYMNAGRDALLPVAAPARTPVHPAANAVKPTEAEALAFAEEAAPAPAEETAPAPAEEAALTPAEETALTPAEEAALTPAEEAELSSLAAAASQAAAALPAEFTAREKELAAQLEAHGPVALSPENQSIIDKAKAYLARLAPKSADGTKFSQRAALYLTAFSIGLEIGTPIMASIKSALNLPLSFAILVTAATYAPYLFGSFIANWVKTKIGRKGTINTGLGLMAGSLAVGTTVLGLDGSFTAWESPTAQYLGLLGVLTILSTGGVFIHNATGPVMTEISHKANDLVRQQRGTYIELSRSIGMMASFGFPFIATSMLGLDWSAPFLLALPVVGASALALNWAKLPNTKLVNDPGQMVRTSKGKLRSSNSYLHLLREAPGVGSFISGLFVMNAVEIALNSGFLFMLPQLTGNESERYLLGMIQFSVAFLAGRFLARHFLKWFPKRNLSIATTLAGLSSAVALGVTDHMYALTAALFTAELGISTTFTLAFARTAKDQKTQDKITSLIMASAVACALGPMLLTTVAQGLMGAGIFNEAGATVATLLGIPTALTLLSAKLFRRTENKTVPGLADGPGWKATLQGWWEKVKNYFR